MRLLTEHLSNHIASNLTTLACCFRLALKTSKIFGFTDHKQDLEIDNVLYVASSGFMPTAIDSNNSLAVDNFDIEGILDNELIKTEDILAGIYDFAELEIFIVDYQEPAKGKITLKRGWLGEVQVKNNRFVFEVRGLSQKLCNVIGDLYSPTCRTKLGSAKCRVNLEQFTRSGVVEKVLSKNSFLDNMRNEQNGFFNYGKIIFETGLNKGISMEVKDYYDSTIIMNLPLPYNISAGDKYTIIAGCDKQFSTCSSKFGNAINFQGEPHIPGVDEMLKTAGTFK